MEAASADMTVYFITFPAVVLFSFLAEQQYEQDGPDDVPGGKYFVKYETRTGYWFFIAGLVLVFVAGFRYRVGTDYGAYYSRYQYFIDNLKHAILTLDEPGYGILAWISTRFIHDGAAAVFSASLVTISLPLIMIYHYTRRLATAAALFIVMGFWHGSFNGVRQYLAAAVLFCGYKYLKERDFLKYCLVVFAAFLFHRSVIVMILLYPAVNRKIDKFNIGLTAAVVALSYFVNRYFFFLAGWVMGGQYEAANEYMMHRVNAIRIAAACVPAVVFLILYWGKELSETEELHLNSLIVYAVIRILTMSSALLYRVGIYTTLFAVIAITELSEGLTDNNKKIVRTGLILMYFLMWWYELYSSESLNPFYWIWQR